MSLVVRACMNCKYFESRLGCTSYEGTCIFHKHRRKVYGDNSCDYFSYKGETIKVTNYVGPIDNVSNVIVYGNVDGIISNCDTVVVINGDIRGNIINSNNICGLIGEVENDNS